MKKLMPSEGLRLGCSSGSTRCVIAKNYVLGQPGGGTFKVHPLLEHSINEVLGQPGGGSGGSLSPQSLGKSTL